MRAEAIERALRNILDQFDPSTPRFLDVDYDDGEGIVRVSAQVPAEFDAMLEAAEMLLNNIAEETPLED